MRALACGIWVIAAVLLMSGCDRSVTEPSQSLVGARHLPPAKILSRETIEINSGFGRFDPGMLSYELRPDNTLRVSLTSRVDSADKPLAVETFRLSSDSASNARRALWRLRPEQLRGVEYDIWPKGCPAPPTDTFPEFTVVFIAEGPKPGVDDDQVGVFAQPSYDSCNKRNVLDANNLVGQVLESFPPSNVPAEFQRRAKLLRKPAQPQRS